MDGIYEKAISRFGVDRQLLQCCEECAELIQAVSKAKRYEGQSYIDGVTEEITDVLIMIEQLKIIFGISAAEIENERERKLKRLERMIRE